MGFLDNLVGDLIAKNTGLPVKGLVKKVGVKNILLAGGAVAAGGLAAHKISESRQTSTPAAAPHQSAPPNLPPVPAGQTPPATTPPLPDLPPVPSAKPTQQAQDAIGDLDAKLELAVVRAMISAALADGVMTPSERSAVQGRLAEASFDDAARQQVHRDLVLPAGPQDIARMVAPEQAETVYRGAYLVVMSDCELAELERTWMDRLAAALGIDPNRRARLESDLQSFLS